MDRKNIEQMEKDKEIRELEEAVSLLEKEIRGFNKREKDLKRELKTLKVKLAQDETEKLKIRQAEEELQTEIDIINGRINQKDKERKKERKEEKEKKRAASCRKFIITVERSREGETEENKEKQTTVIEVQEVKREKEKKEEKGEEELVHEIKKQEEEEQKEERIETPKEQEISDSEEVTTMMEDVEMDAAATSTSRGNLLQRVLSRIRASIQSKVQSIIKFRKCLFNPIVLHEEEEHEDVSAPVSYPLVPLGAPTGVLTVNIKRCTDLSKITHMQKDSLCMVRITVGRMVKCTRLRPFKENVVFNEDKHFSIQIQKDEPLGIKKSSSVLVELISTDGHSAATNVIGSTTIQLKEVLNKLSVTQRFDLRLKNKKVCKLDADLAFTYGSFGYGYSHQMNHPGKTTQDLVKNSLFPRCTPAEDRRDLQCDGTPGTSSSVDAERGRECSIPADTPDCINRRGRLSQLRKVLEVCETRENRVQFLESLVFKPETCTNSPCKVEQRSKENREDVKAEEGVKKGKAKWKTRK